MERKPLQEYQLDRVLEDIRQHTYEKIKKHGPGAFVSNHEAFGAITEEYYELLEELRKNNREGFRMESLDLIVAILWGILSDEGFDQTGSSETPL